MPDGRPPDLPETAPIELREFIECKRASVTISSGPLTWLPLPPDIRDYAPTPTMSLTPGATPGTGTMTIDLMITSFELPVSVVDGDLRIDPSGVSSIPGAQETIDTWTKDFNDWLKKNGQRLKPATIAGGSVTLVKEPIPVPPAGGGGTVGGGGTPPTPVPPVTPTPPPAGGGSSNSGCWLLGLIALLLVGVIGVGGVTGFLPLPFGGGGGGATAEPSGSQAGAPGPTVTAGSSTGPSTGASTGPSTGPTATATATATAAAPAAPAPAGTEAALAFLKQHLGFTDADIAKLDWQVDPAGDWYFPQPGIEPTQHPPEIDVTSAVGVRYTLTPEQAARLSELIPCEKETALDDGTEYIGACNQATKPMLDGDHLVLITDHAGAYPSDVPAAALHSWSVYTDADTDPATGFTSTAPDNYLIGADTFFEVVAFTSASGAREYILATRMADPVRPDTGQRQGNLATTARAVWFQDDGTFLWFIPEDDFGPNWNAGAFATTNRGANSPDTLAADALGDPTAADWRKPMTFSAFVTTP